MNAGMYFRLKGLALIGSAINFAIAIIYICHKVYVR